MARRVQRRHGVKTDLYQAVKVDMPSEEKEVISEAVEAAPLTEAEEPVKDVVTAAEPEPSEEGSKPSKKNKNNKDKGFLNSLNKVREADTSASIPASVLSTILVLIFGVMIGVIAQAAEFFGENSTIWWQDIIKDLEMNVIFTKFPIWFLLGLTVSVCSQRPLKAAINELVFFIGTIVGRMMLPRIFSEAAPPDDIFRWVIIAIIAVPLAVIFWYAKSRSLYSIIFSGKIMMDSKPQNSNQMSVKLS